MANTTNRSYPKPVEENNVSDDVLLLQQAFDMIDDDVAALLASLAGKANLSHGHAMADITGLAAALALKAAADHAHAFDDLSDVSSTAAAPNGYVLQKASGGWVPVPVNSIIGAQGSLQIQIDGGASAPAIGAAWDFIVPYACTITGWTLLANATGSIEFEVLKGAYASFPPSAPISGALRPKIANAAKGQSNSLTGWTTTLSANEILRFRVASAEAITRVLAVLNVTRN